MSASEPPDRESAESQRDNQKTGDGSKQLDHPKPEQITAAAINLLAQMGIKEDDPNLQVILSEVQMAYRGPIPPPSMLADYDDVMPGLAKEIIEAWRDQRRHRIGRETRESDGSETRMNNSQRNALIVSIIGIVVAAIAGIWGGWLLGTMIVLIAVGGPNAATIIARLIGSPRD